MAASLITLLLFCQLLSASAELQPQHLTVCPGDDVTLPCQAPNNITIAVVEWKRPGLEKYVYVKQDGHVVTTDQDPSYKNRVQLKDDEMKNGDLSLVLKKVNYNDEGRYQCVYKEKRGGRRKRADQKKHLVYLEVGSGNGHNGVILSGALFLLAVGGLVGVGIYNKRRGRSESKSDQPGDDPAESE